MAPHCLKCFRQEPRSRRPALTASAGQHFLSALSHQQTGIKSELGIKLWLWHDFSSLGESGRPVARRVHWMQLHPLRVSMHSLALRFAPSVIPLVQWVQSEVPEGAIAHSAPVWLRTWSQVT